MNNPLEMCCFCLNVSESLMDVFSKSDDTLTHFDKISKTLSQLPTVLKDLDCNNYMLCNKCSDTIDSVYQFHEISLHNVKIYSVQVDVLKNKDANEKLEILTVETIDEQSGDETNGTDFDKDEIFLDYSMIEDSDEDQNFVERTERKNVDPENPEINLPLSEKPGTSIPRIVRIKKGKPKRRDSDPDILESKKKSHQGNRVYKCRFCNKLFTQSNNLLDHERIHMGVKPWVCDVCGRSFVQKQHLNRHMLTHSDQKLHVCGECNKGFKRKDDLEKHKLCHSGLKPHACDICDRRFRDKSDLVKHTRIHTGEKPYACNVCDKTFNRNSLLVNHRRIHTGERPYSCELCTKTFSTTASLYYHVLSHSGKRSYKCEQCSKSFVQRCTLNKHKKKFNH